MEDVESKLGSITLNAMRLTMFRECLRGRLGSKDENLFPSFYDTWDGRSLRLISDNQCDYAGASVPGGGGGGGGAGKDI